MKFSTNVKQKKLSVNSQYYIEVFGINSLGMPLEYRKINPSYEILNGNELINDCKIQKNKFTFHTKDKIGNVKLLIKTQYSLNPIIFNFSIILIE